MKIAVLREYRSHENRVAVTPDTVKRFSRLGFAVVIETGAGLGSNITDSAYIDVGAKIENDFSKQD